MQQSMRAVFTEQMVKGTCSNSSCHHTRSFEFLEHFSSYVTQWISSTTLPVIKENAFCIATGYSGTTIRKMGDFSTFGYCLQWQD